MLGAVRLLDGGGIAAALVVGLLLARTHAWSLSRVLTLRTWNASLFATIVQGEASPDEKIGVEQFFAFVVTIAFVAGATLLMGAAIGLLSRWRRGRLGALALDVAVIAGAVIGACRVNAFVGQLAVDVIAFVGLIVAPYSGGTLPYARPTQERTLTAMVLVSEAICAAWTVWFLVVGQLGPSTLVIVLGLVLLVGLRVGSHRSHRDRTLARDALAGTPLLLLPFVGLLRAPSLAWVIAAAILVLTLRFALERTSSRPVPDWLSSAVAPASVAATLLLPLRFRELGDASHRNHEGQHLGWLMSAMHGKLLFADSGFTYGPLREYVLGAIAWALGGVHLDHVRIAHVLLNLVGVALLLFVGWRVVRKRFWPFLFWWWLVLAKTPASFFLDYQANFSFGWVDDARAGIALLALVLALDGVDRPRSRSALGRRWLQPMTRVGLLSAVSILYSQDCGVVALIVVVLTLPLDALLRRRPLPTAQRLTRALVSLGQYLGGVSIGVGAFVAYYVARGRGHALLEVLRYESALGAGMYGAIAAPLSATDFLRHAALFGEVPGGWKLDYYLPMLVPMVGVAVVAASAFRGRWSSRTSLVCALTLFSCAMFRYGLTRADLYHVAAASISSYMLLAGFVADASALQPRVGSRWKLPLPAGAVVFGGLVLWTMWNMKKDEGLNVRLGRMLAGTEVPSSGPAYRYEEIPRVGDQSIDPRTISLVSYVRANTTPTDSIWVVFEFITGGEIYFLSERADATPYDVWSEVFTRRDVDRVMEALRTTPPTLIIGHGFNYTAESTAYVEKHWKVVTAIDGIKIRRFDPTTF